MTMVNSSVTVEQRSQFAIVRINNPPVNATSTHVRAGLLDAVTQVNNMQVVAAILICSGKTFIAGGDMTEFDRPPETPHLPDVVQAIEDSSVPFVAAIHGYALGGGLEIALGCAWRIATRSTKFGMPEVNVGLIPGAGGTQRLPRLVGIELALQMCTDGKPVSAQTMLDNGGLDAVIDNHSMEAAAIRFSETAGTRPLKISQRTVNFSSKQALVDRRTKLEKNANGPKAPLLNFDAVLWSSDPFAVRQPQERALHLALRKSKESVALRHAFTAERTVSKPAIIKGVNPRPINQIAIFGGGQMGSGIATVMLNADLKVVVVEHSLEALRKASLLVDINLKGALDRGKISAAQYDDRLKNLTVTLDATLISNSDLVVEAVFEDTRVKQTLLDTVSRLVGPDTIMATNTSYLDPNTLFSNVVNPNRCIGMHFFSPAHIMRLIEIIPLPETSPTVVSTVFKLAKLLNKVGVQSGICNGFIGNRMLAAYRREAEYMLADGAMPHEIDIAMRSYGYAMGPFEAQDMSGHQIAWANRRIQDHQRPETQRYVSIADTLCNVGRFGQKSGKGWYSYPDGPGSKIRDSQVENIVVDYSNSQGITRRPFNNSEIVDRLIAVLANEGALIDEEGIAENDAAIDIVQILGYGFPRWKGGPMHVSDTIGRQAIANTLKGVVDASPNSWQTADRFSS